MNSIGADDLPVGWSRTTLGIVVDVLDHLRVPVNAEERSKRVGSVPYYGATGQVGWIDDHIFDEELVLLGEDGAPFLDPAKPKAYMISGKSWVNNHAHVLCAKLGLGNRFLLYQLNQADFRPFVSGTTRLKLPQAPMRRLPLVIAPEAEQRRMVAEIERQLTRLDAAVEALKRVQANLKRYRASVLKTACEGRLVPMEAELARAEGRDYETGAQLLARILKERRAKWEADQLAKMHAGGKPQKDEKWKRRYSEPTLSESTNLPCLPQGWVWATLEMIAGIQLGKMLSPKAYEEGLLQLPYLRNENVRWGSIDFSDVKRMGFKETELERHGLRPGDLLVCEGGEPGRCAVYSGAASRFMYQKALHRVRPIAGLVDPHYIQFWLERQIISGSVLPKPSETTIRHLPLEKMQIVPIPLPPLREQARILAEIENRLTAISEIKKIADRTIDRAERLRQAVLRRAFEGKLVPQDPSDEPASALLERVRAERASGGNAMGRFASGARPLRQKRLGKVS